MTLRVATLVGVVKSGRVAWVVDVLAGLLAVGAGCWMGRDRLATGLTQVGLPGALVGTLLWERRIERLIADGRTRCHAAVKDLVQRELDALAPSVTEQIRTRVKPLLGERQRLARAGTRRGEGEG